MGTQVAVDEMLPALPSSAGKARRLLRDALPGEASEEAVDAAALALSEIVTNALVHAGTPMRLRVIVAQSTVRVELADGSAVRALHIVGINLELRFGINLRLI